MVAMWPPSCLYLDECLGGRKLSLGTDITPGDELLEVGLVDAEVASDFYVRDAPLEHQAPSDLGGRDVRPLGDLGGCQEPGEPLAGLALVRAPPGRCLSHPDALHGCPAHPPSRRG